MAVRRLTPYSFEPKAATNRPFRSSDIRTIYGYPSASTVPVVAGVVSLGGTLTGTIDANGFLTGGDIQAYWTSLGMTSQPRVKIIRLNGSAFDPTDSLSTAENTLDVEMLGACCPTSNLTILFYYYNQYTAPQNIDTFYSLFNYAINTPVSLPGRGLVKPSVISCSWGAPENLFSATELSRYDTLFASGAAAGITITTAAGDTGSHNGQSFPVADFPTSSPNVISCGGTTLVCPNMDSSGNFIHTGATETTWSFSSQTGLGTGGGISKYFRGPPYPTTQTSFRQVPDVSLVANPNTGVSFLINGTSQVMGGTSIVAPAIAGLIACLPLASKGFLKRLYALPLNAFHDTVSGQNGQYSAAVGYDNCTGRGSVNGSVFVPAYISQVAITGVPVITGPLNVERNSTRQLSSSAPVWWVSSNPVVASVSDTGLVSGLTLGTTTISAYTIYGFFQTSVTFTVTGPVTVVRVSIQPNGSSVSSIIIRRNRSLQVYSSVSPVSWTTTNSSLFTVTNGVVQSRGRVGIGILRATSGQLSATVQIRVI